MSTPSTTASSGIGFTGLLALLFITLKLVGVIAWSWWWVLCPLWGPLALIGGILGIVFVGLLIAVCCGVKIK